MRVWKDWGFEDIIENNENYCLKKLTCLDEKWSSKGAYHYHPVKDETFYVISGILQLDVELEEGVLMSCHRRIGEAFRITPGMKHRFKSVTQKCEFIEASTHHSDEDTVRVRHVVDSEKKTSKWEEVE
jgi:mannose-6-phosphate isomerase-like protein (cupin superfamily)